MDGSSKKLISNEVAHFSFAIGVFLSVILIIVIGVFLYKTFNVLISVQSTPTTSPVLEEMKIERSDASEPTPPPSPAQSPPQSPPQFPQSPHSPHQHHHPLHSKSSEDRIRALVEEENTLTDQLNKLPPTIRALQARGPNTMFDDVWQKQLKMLKDRHDSLTKRWLIVTEELQKINSSQ